MVTYGLGAGLITGSTSCTQGIGKKPAAIHIVTGMQVLQPVRNGNIHLGQNHIEQTVVYTEYRLGQHIQTGVQSSLQINRHANHGILITEQHVKSLAGMEHSRGTKGIFLFPMKRIVLRSKSLRKRIGSLIKHGIASYELRSLHVKSSGDRDFAMFFILLLQPFDANHHFIVVTDTHGFRNVALQVGTHGMIKPRQPVGLIGKYACQREDDKHHYVFRR